MKILFLRNDGPRSTAARVRVEPDDAQIRLVSHSVLLGGAPSPGVAARAPVRLEFAADMEEGSATLIIEASDAERRPESDELWERDFAREAERTTLRWRKLRPSTMEVRQDVVVFHADLDEPSGDIVIANVGDQDLSVTIPSEPKGFRLHVPAGPALIEPQGCLVVPVECVLEHPYGDAQEDIVFEGGDGTFHRVRLRTVAEPHGFSRPDWVVAVDFGTSNTSMVARQKLPDGRLSEELIPILGPAGQENSPRLGRERFPSAICWYRGEWTFADEAIETAKQHDSEPEATRPRLFHEETSLKRHLHAEGEPFVRNGATDHEFRLDRLAERYFRWLHDEFIRPFLAGQRDDTIATPFHVQYVLTLPVLDGEAGPLYERQKSRTVSAAARALGVPATSIRTVFEPESAAMHFLIGRSPLRDTAVHFDDGQGVCVFDSGGGTTDIFFGEVVMRNGRLSLRTIHNLGLSAERETFGGVTISHAVHTGFNRKDYRDLFHDPCEFVAGSEIDSRGDVSCKTIAKSVDAFKQQHIAAAQGFEALAAANEAAPAVVSEYCGDGPSEELIQNTATKLRDVFEAIDRKMESIYATVNPLFDMLPPIRWVFPVGGNTLIHRVEAWCRTICYEQDYTENLKVAENDRMLAVAWGAPFVLDVPLEGRAHYSVRVVILLEDGNEEELCDLGRYAPVHDRHPSVRHFTGKAMLTITSADAALADADASEPTEAVLFRQSLPAAHETYLTVRLQDRIMEITSKPALDACETQVFSLKV